MLHAAQCMPFRLRVSENLISEASPWNISPKEGTDNTDKQTGHACILCSPRLRSDHDCNPSILPIGPHRFYKHVCKLRIV
ncbi:unnamed protein product [Periconia digitata]|uniref:Uncharacterized protein n=1 Tax=Periconia digitata TaxID=1303443 RepID=A0A9W4XWM5_9PLEO|nr:unnamed protein product [Periconia digitata]